MNSLFKSFGLALGILLVGATTAVAANDTLTIISAPFGKTGYIMGSACEDIIKKSDSGLKITQEEGYGMFYNLKKLHAADPETKSQGLFHQIQKEVTFCGLPHGADA